MGILIVKPPSIKMGIIPQNKQTSHASHLTQLRVEPSTKSPAPRILLHGSGAIGTIYVYLLSEAGHSVTAVCRSNYSVAKSKGFFIDSEKYGHGIRIHPQIVESTTEAAGSEPYDYVIVATKALPESETSKVIAPVVNEGRTTIVLIQNGIGIEDEYSKAFPNNPLLSCVAYLPTTQISPGHVQMGGFERLEVGSFPANSYSEDERVRESAEKFVAILRDSGSDTRRYDDVQEKRWNKLLINAPWNPICALTLSRDVAFLSSSDIAASIVEDVMLEVVKIAEKLGYTSINASAAKEQLQRATRRVGGKGIEPSMLVDVLNGRRMEVEAILGNPVRLAKTLNIQVPKLELLYVLLKALDEATALRQPGQSLGGDETKTAAVNPDFNKL